MVNIDDDWPNPHTTDWPIDDEDNEISNFWYCEHCQTVVNPMDVTYEELHEQCQNPVEWIDNNWNK